MDRLAPLFVILAAILWGVDGIVLRPALYGLPVPLVVLIESGIVALILSPFFVRKFSKINSLHRKDWLAFWGVAVFGGALGTMAIVKALFYVNFVNLSIVVLIQKLQPVFALILAAVLLKEKLPKEFFYWSALALTGTYFLTFGFNIPILDTGDKTFEASMYAVIAAFSFGFSTVLSKRALRSVSYSLGTYLRFLLTTLIMLFLVLMLGDYNSIREITTTQFIAFMIIAFSSGGLAIFFYYYGLKKITASVATICELAFPLTAIILEYLIRGNILGPVQWFGAIILVAGIIKVSGLKISKRKEY